MFQGFLPIIQVHNKSWTFSIQSLRRFRWTCTCAFVHSGISQKPLEVLPVVVSVTMVSWKAIFPDFFFFFGVFLSLARIINGSFLCQGANVQNQQVIKTVFLPSIKCTKIKQEGGSKALVKLVDRVWNCFLLHPSPPPMVYSLVFTSVFLFVVSTSQFSRLCLLFYATAFYLFVVFWGVCTLLSFRFPPSLLILTILFIPVITRSWRI